MRKLGVALLLASCSAGFLLPKKAEGPPVLAVGGAVKGGPFSLGRADLDKVPRHGVRGVDPATGRAAHWEGPSLEELVVKRVEPQKGVDAVLVRTADRAAIAIPLAVVRLAKPVIADRADGQRLTSSVLAWPTLDAPGLDTDPRATLWWAHDVVALDLVDWQKTFGAALATPDGAADGARRGSFLFGERCVACHRLRGVGGARGPELTTVTTRIREERFAALLSKHPGWTGTGGDPPGEQGADEIWSFLHAVAVAGPNATSPEPVTAERARPGSSTP